MLKPIAISFFVCVAFTTSVEAGYTDVLWNESEDREYYDCADWSGIENNQNTNIKQHYYSFRKSIKRNRKAMFKAERFGLPADASLSRGFPLDDIAWQSIYIKGYTYTIAHKEKTYTNDSGSIDYRNDYLEYRTHNSGLEQNKNIVGRPSSSVKISTDGFLIATTAYDWFNYNADKHGTFVKRISKRLPMVAVWNSPNLEINATITEHRGYSILDIPTPNDVVGIKITAKNGTAVYEKYSHCLKTNSTKSGYQYYDLIECDVRTFSGIFPYGTDRYLIGGEPSNISVELLTPFEGHNATLTITTIECITDEPTHFKNHSMYAFAMFLLPVVLSIWLYRRF